MKVFATPKTALLALSMSAVPMAATAQEVINITIGASHPPVVAWVGQITNTFIPEVNRILAEEGNYTVEFNEMYGGTLYNVNETLTAISEGLADVGWVFSLVEGSRLPLTQVTGYLPGVTSDPILLMDVFNELNATLPALQEEWARQNVVFLSATSADGHQLFTTFPVESLADLEGRRISAPGSVGTWMGNTGAIPVDGAATTFYTDASTGLTDGANTTLSVANSIGYFEVAPYVTIANLGSTFFGGLIVNQDVWDGLPEEVQAAFREAAGTYSTAVGEDVNGRVGGIMERLRTEGPNMDPPIVITEMSDEERAAWINGLPNLAQQWVEENEANGLPAREVLQAYMAAARAAGATPIRNWDEELQ